MLLPSLKASFARSDDGNELVPMTGLDGPSLRAYSDQLRELQICRDDLLARRSMNNTHNTSEAAPQRRQSSDSLLCPTPMGRQASSDQAASSTEFFNSSVSPMPQPPIASTNVAAPAVARKRRLGFPSNLEKSKLQPGGAAFTSSSSAETVAADILDLTGQLKASAGEVNSTLKAQTAILEKTGEEALQNVERVKRETDKVGVHLSRKRRNMFATFSAMAMALASFIVVYLLIIMPFGKKRTLSSHIAPLFFSRTRGDHGGGLETVDHHPVQSCNNENEEASNYHLTKDENSLDGPPSSVVSEEDNQELRAALDFNFNFNCLEGGGSDACDEDHAEVLLCNHLTNVERVVDDVDGGVQRFVDYNIEVKENNRDKSAEVEGLDDMPPEATKNFQEPNTGEMKKYPDDEMSDEEEVMVELLPNVVVEEETKTKRSESSFVNLGDGPNFSEETSSIPNEGDDVVVTQGPPQHLVENDAKILLDSSSRGEGAGVSEEAEEVVKVIDVHLEGTIAAANQSSDPVDVVSSPENTTKYPPVGNDKDEEGVGKIQFQAAVAECTNTTEACATFGTSGVAADLELEKAVELQNIRNESQIVFHETQQDAAPRTTKGGREKEEVVEGVLSSPEEDDNNMNGDDGATKSPIMSQERKEANDEFLQQRFKLERSKLQVFLYHCVCLVPRA